MATTQSKAASQPGQLRDLKDIREKVVEAIGTATNLAPEEKAFLLYRINTNFPEARLLRVHLHSQVLQSPSKGAKDIGHWDISEI